MSLDSKGPRFDKVALAQTQVYLVHVARRVTPAVEHEHDEPQECKRISEKKASISERIHEIQGSC